MCVLSIGGVVIAKVADQPDLAKVVPEVSAESVETLLKIISASMLVMAIFAVGSMVSAYASAGSNATPRAFPLVVADDVSQNALSAFVGAFIFSLAALVPLLNNFYGPAGLFTLLVFTILVFALVILTFVWWVDRIARLGRLGATIEKAERATATALARRRRIPRLGGVAPAARNHPPQKIYGHCVGYVQQVRVADLQAVAEEHHLQVEVAALPGSFASPAQPLVCVYSDTNDLSACEQPILNAFTIGKHRTFEDDPRFGLVVLSEIAGKALSPGINDPGTAIGVIGTLVRLFVLWQEPTGPEDLETEIYDRVAVPLLRLDDMFEDAFAAIARDGSGTIEVVVRLLKGYQALAAHGHGTMKSVADHHAAVALARAEESLSFSQDIDAARKAAQFALQH